MVFCLVSCIEESCFIRRLGILGARVLGLVYYVWIPLTVSRVAEGLRPITSTSPAYIVQFIYGMWCMHESGTSLSAITSSNCSGIECPQLSCCNQDSSGFKFCEMLRHVDLQIDRRFGEAYCLHIQGQRLDWKHCEACASLLQLLDPEDEGATILRNLHGGTFQNTSVLNSAALRALSLPQNQW